MGTMRVLIGLPLGGIVPHLLFIHAQDRPEIDHAGAVFFTPGDSAKMESRPTKIKDGAEGTSSAKDEKNSRFEYKGGNLAIPFPDDQVNDLEWVESGRRIGLAIAISPWLLFPKKRKHFLTVG